MKKDKQDQLIKQLRYFIHVLSVNISGIKIDLDYLKIITGNKYEVD